ncbi:MAG TPA: DNA-directed RNA polymerase subunit alpha [Patescibacteria group bacterium]|nr:DNA-directed RNA polymerase subunit alpha [Patescibacteria group bacterium]
MSKPNFITEVVDEKSGIATFIISPLPAGFGHTIGNALRRILLSSISGSAVTYIKINDAVHAFSTIKGIKESVLDIILNIKLLRFNVVGDGPFAVTLSEKGIQKIIGGHFKSGDVEIVNKDLYIAEITVPKGKLDIQLVVEKGSGYSSSEEKEKKEFGMIAVDSIFSPVVKVNYSVEGARVGRKTNFDKLMLQIFTDKSVSPHDALMQSSQLMSEYFSYILSGKDVKKNENDEDKSDGNLLYKVDKKVYQTIIDELDLPTRVINALLREKIETVEDLIKKGKDELVGLKGLGEKSLDLIHKELEKLGIDF